MSSSLVKIAKALSLPENQYCALMLPVWIANAEKFIKPHSDNYNPDQLYGIRLKYILNHVCPAIRYPDNLRNAQRGLNYNASTYKYFIELVTPCIFKEGDCFEIKRINPVTSFITKSTYKFVRTDSTNNTNIIVYLEDGASDTVYMPAATFYKMPIYRTVEPVGFYTRKKGTPCVVDGAFYFKTIAKRKSKLYPISVK